MANPEHLEILKRGSQQWNSWRRGNRHITPDLSDGTFSDSELTSIDFTASNLQNSLLMGADLSLARFDNSNMRGAMLNSSEALYAHFANVDLEGGALMGANLTDTDFTNARLIKVEMQHANSPTRNCKDLFFDSAIMSQTILSGVDLSTCAGLSTVIHQGPSPIGIDTAYRSKGQIPEIFLRGAGVPDSFIQYMRSLVATNAIQYYSCFISYSTKNQEFADRIHTDLDNKGVRNWLATEDLKIGDKFRTEIEKSIRMHDKLLLVLSETSVASPWVESEVESAMERERRENRLVLFPVMLDNAVMDTPVAWAADIRRTRHIGDFRDWKNQDSYKKAFDSLLRDSKAENTQPKA